MISTEELYKRISESLLIDYTSVYYVDAVTNEYFWFSVDPDFYSLRIEPKGDDFFVNIVRDAQNVIYQDDLHIFLEDMKKEKLLAGMKAGHMEEITYRMVIGGKPVWYSLRMIHQIGDVSEEDDYFILGVMNIDKEYREREKAKKLASEREIFDRITESLVNHYDFLCYIEIESGQFSAYSSSDSFDSLLNVRKGENFFADPERWVGVLYPEDRDRILGVLEKDYLISAMENQGRYTTSYRYLDSDKQKVHYARANVTWSKDKTHFILGAENIDHEIEKEQEHVKALNIANEMARRDELTGIRNKTAYQEAEEELQKAINEERCEAFALVICDINDLKHINDTRGHKAGDDYIRYASGMICRIFSHSPVFRIGGDEFVIILQGQDYSEREDLMNRIRNQVSTYLDSGEGVIVACGVAEYNKNADRKVSDVFERADFSMYDNKKDLKEKTILKETNFSSTEDYEQIPENRKKKLDDVFKAVSVVSEGTYVYVCDMRYDLSRWSKTAVEAYGLPAEYMYGAGEIWEERIHPDDREVYRLGISDIFAGTSYIHDMQYRALKKNGEYEFCTCRGYVVKDLEGKMEYFIGTIKTLGVQGNIDTLTGFRNQHGFFEDLRRYLEQKREIAICLLGINKFSEINEVYGYKFGNLVLQSVSRRLMEQVGNNGAVYRMDGTKFAIISSVYSMQQMNIEYEKFRNYFRGKFNVEDRNIMLEFNSGVVDIKNFEVDDQTLYACLNFAYDESKQKKHGDMVEFDNELNKGNRNRIQVLHAIRSSIPNGYKGFFLLYQPVVDVKTERVFGAEALLRWKNEEFGVVPPDTFISLLEMDSLFPDLGEWIIRSAILCTKTFMKVNPEFIIHVNLSYTQLEKPEFSEAVARILKETDFPPEHLCLEVTERCRLLDMDLLKNVIASLRAQGVLVALDDFGTGYSSLGALKELPFDIIKIDRSFIRRIEVDESEREMMKHFTAIAGTCKANVCVEGVETEGMRDILREYPVQTFQGYLYAKPLETDAFLAYMQKKDMHIKDN